MPYVYPMTTTLHAHVETSSSDCDGPFYRHWVDQFNADERKESMEDINDFSDIHFMNRVFTNNCGPYAVSHQLTIKVDSEGFEWNEQTDEGYRAGHVIWCTDDCDLDESGQRDVYAEQMGY